MNTDKVIAEKIASEYAPKSENKLEALKKLDRKAKRPAEIFAYTFGIVMALVLGLGMCLSMGQIGDNSKLSIILGIIIGVLGIIGVSINYIVYKKILACSKKKYASDIMLLATEVINEE